MTNLEVEALQAELAAARREIENLQLRLANVTLLLRKEMLVTAKSQKSHNEERVSN